MTAVPEVSVVIPAYEPGALLHRAVRSVLDQELARWELLVVDDGGAEDLAWVDEVDPRVRRVRQENRGVSVARNVGVLHARADLVAFLDQDDEWLPGKLTAQVAAMRRRPSAVLCYTGYEWVWPDRTVPTPHVDQPVTHLGLLHDQHLCLSTAVARRQEYLAVGGHDPRLALMQDFDWFLRMTSREEPLLAAGIYARYHVHGSSTSNTWTTDYRRGRAERRAVLQAHLRVALARGDAVAAAAAERGLDHTDRIYGPMAYDQFRASVRRRRPDWRHLSAALQLSPRYTASSLARRTLTGPGPRESVSGHQPVDQTR